jgi:hypothetical protein
LSRVMERIGEMRLDIYGRPLERIFRWKQPVVERLWRRIAVLRGERRTNRQWIGYLPVTANHPAFQRKASGEILCDWKFSVLLCNRGSTNGNRRRACSETNWTKHGVRIAQAISWMDGTNPTQFPIHPSNYRRSPWQPLKFERLFSVAMGLEELRNCHAPGN